MQCQKSSLGSERYICTYHLDSIWANPTEMLFIILATTHTPSHPTLAATIITGAVTAGLKPSVPVSCQGMTQTSDADEYGLKNGG